MSRKKDAKKAAKNASKRISKAVDKSIKTVERKRNSNRRKKVLVLTALGLAFLPVAAAVVFAVVSSGVLDDKKNDWKPKSH